MATLESDFESPDLDVLLEAMDEWEKVGGEALQIIKFLKDFPADLMLKDAPEEVMEAFQHFKKNHLSKEREVLSKRKLRGERATLLKAKIILMKQEAAMDRLGDPGDLGDPIPDPPATDPDAEELPPAV